jgi:hypothetical protein
VSLYFFPLWSGEAVRVLVSRYSGLEDRAQAAAAAYVARLFDLGPGGLVLASHVLAGIKFVIAAAFACYLIEFSRSLAVRREADRNTVDVVLILAVVGVVLSVLPALALGDVTLFRVAATQTLMVAGAIAIIAVERQVADASPKPVASRVTTAMREREFVLGLPAGTLVAEPPPAQTAAAFARIPEARLRRALTRA